MHYNILQALHALHALHYITQAEQQELALLGFIRSRPRTPNLHSPQWARWPRGARGFGRVNSGTWFQAAQYRANQLAAAAGGRGTKCAVAGLVWVSDSSFGGKNTQWHGVYGAYKARNLSGCSNGMHVI